jgi:hypothetical protein
MRRPRTHVFIARAAALTLLLGLCITALLSAGMRQLEQDKLSLEF